MEVQLQLHRTYHDYVPTLHSVIVRLDIRHETGEMILFLPTVQSTGLRSRRDGNGTTVLIDCLPNIRLSITS